MIRMVTTAIIFDLDETLIEDFAATERALEKASRHASTAYDALDPLKLKQAALAHSEHLWESSPVYDYCENIGISCSEGMWGEFVGDEPPLQTLFAWAPMYQHNIWQLALLDQQVDDNQLAAELARLFREERRLNYQIFPEVEAMLTALRQKYRLAILTNGAPDLQHGKIALKKLAPYFDAIVVSGDVGVGKPHPDVYSAVLNKLSVHPEEAVMVGDSLRNDVFGAQQSGLKGIWMNRENLSASPNYASSIFATIKDVDELPDVLP
jgi:putative hydrolase of the HAD superfamily